ncbi:MAG TPA: hypothetical protein DCO68_08185 [Methylophilaceae bacterium]|nr:hypothetical protein [Methylophilaceae bacterium]HAJ72044.1 hypothetical protein [Methylophilaceae bacterium]
MKPLSVQQSNALTQQFQQGQRALQLGAYTLAEQHFLNALKINPNNIESRAYLAFVYTSTKQLAKATLELKTLLKTNINLAQTHHNLANVLFEQQLYNEALSHYQAAIKIDSKRIESLIDCGVCYHRMKDYERAIDHLEQAYSLDKNNVRLLHILGVIFTELEKHEQALNFLEKATQLAPNQPIYKLCYANTLERATFVSEAEILYHQTCESAPNYLDAFLTYGEYLFKNRFYDEALECFKHAEALAPQNLKVLRQLGLTYMGMGDTESTEKYLNLALQVDKDNISTLTSLGQAYIESGDAEKAQEIANTLIKIDANSHLGYTLQSSAKKSTLSDNIADNLLSLLNNTSLNLEDNIKSSIHFSLGKVFNDHNNYQEAFKHYALGNTLTNQSLGYNKEIDQTKVSNLIDMFNPSFFNAHSHLGVDSNLPVIIVGMPRSGTTLTEQIISSHPQVLGAGEVIFWGGAPAMIPLRLKTDTPYPQCLSEMDERLAHDIAGLYERALRKTVGLNNNPKHITDKMPHNFMRIGLIALLFPNVKIIHTIRDPIDTCLSIYFQNFNANGHPYAFNLENLGFHYKQYQRIMRHWHTVLPGRIMDIHYEDTIADPEYWSRKLIDHIGLEWDDACLAPHKLERAVKTASHWQVRQPIYKTSVQRWKHYEEFLGPLIEALKD